MTDPDRAARRPRRLGSSGVVAIVVLVAVLLLALFLGRGRVTAPAQEGGPPAVPMPVAAAVYPATGEADAAAPERDPAWAVPLDEPGLPNLHKVSDTLYRSAQPTAEGMRRAKEMGIRTVLNLRSFHSDRDEIGDTGLAYEGVSAKAWHPEDEDVVRFLQIVTDPARQPVLVHCQHGADRTGTMCAVYRVVVGGWPVKEAIREMEEGGYGFHGIWDGTLGDYLRELDFKEIKRSADLAPENTGGDADAD